MTEDIKITCDECGFEEKIEDPSKIGATVEILGFIWTCSNCGERKYVKPDRR